MEGNADDEVDWGSSDGDEYRCSCREWNRFDGDGCRDDRDDRPDRVELSHRMRTAHAEQPESRRRRRWGVGDQRGEGRRGATTTNSRPPIPPSLPPPCPEIKT